MLTKAELKALYPRKVAESDRYLPADFLIREKRLTDTTTIRWSETRVKA